jgi:hypothetical protein
MIEMFHHYLSKQEEVSVTDVLDHHLKEKSKTRVKKNVLAT